MVQPKSNPFRPGAGRRPPVLAGRGALLEAFEVVISRAEEHGEGDRPWILSGLRGVGKTVLLRELLGQVGQRGWITAKVEAGAGPSLPVALSTALLKAVRTATGHHPESGCAGCCRCSPRSASPSTQEAASLWASTSNPPAGPPTPAAS